jgi:nitrate/nitrite-specific signal transduction histidine kinase
VENELLRVLQEALSNVAKHARAQTVNVTWTVKDATGVLVIEDDGRGFDPVRGVRDSAYGLVGMRERTDGVDARLAIESAPGKGTTVTVVAGRGVDQWRQAEHPAAREAMATEHRGDEDPTRVTNGVTTA